MERYLELFEKIGDLKHTEREGWKRVGIDDPESVADHSFRAAFMSLIIGEKFDLDGFKLVKLLLVHDLAESEIGDITPEDPTSEQEKFEREENFLKDISRSFGDDFELAELWKEFESGESREALIARDIDKLEMILQALEYKEEYPNKDLSEFISSAEENIESQEIKQFLQILSRN